MPTPRARLSAWLDTAKTQAADLASDSLIPSLDIRHSLDKLVADLGLIRAEALPAAARAMNRTMTTVRARSARMAQASYPGMRIAALKKQLKLIKASVRSPRAVLIFSEKRFSLYHNWRGVRQTGRGVKVLRHPWAIELWDGTRVDLGRLRDAFIQRPLTNRGQWSVYVREGRARYPIQGLVVPSLASAFVEEKIGEAMALVTRERFALEFEREGKYRLSKRA